jgi:hypothetical protein
MAFNVNEFRNHFGKYEDFAKTDKFEVWIAVPNALSNSSIFGVRELIFQCEAAELPGKNINMIEYRHYAFTNRIPHFINYGEMSLTFYCNGKLEEKKFFDAWFESMIPTNSGLVNYQSNEEGSQNYSTRINIRQYSQVSDDQGQPKLIYECALIDAIPTSISPLSLNWGEDSVHRLQVSFAYKKWTSTSGVSDHNSQSNAVTNYSNDVPKNG